MLAHTDILFTFCATWINVLDDARAVALQPFSSADIFGQVTNTRHHQHRHVQSTVYTLHS